MGSLFPSRRERDLYAKMMLEAASMLGVRVEVKFIEKVVLDMYQDPIEQDFYPPKTLDILLEEYPQIKKLRNLHWYNENDEVLPILANLSKKDYDDNNILTLKDSLIEMPYLISEKAGTKMYEITDSRAYGPGPLYWICKLAPVREKFVEEIEEETQDENFTYLKIDR